MAKYDSAGLAMIPSGYKASKVYSLIPNSSSGDFDFARSSSATRVNKDGLIETVATNVPRLDYPLIDGVVQDTPSLLLEPSRTNIVLRSEDIDTGWSKLNVTVANNQTTSPDGNVSAGLSTATSTSGSHASYDTFTASVTPSATHYISCFVKKSTTRHIRLIEGYSTAGLNFDFDTITYALENGATNEIVEDFGNEWYRIGFSFTSNATGDVQFALYINDNDNNASYAGTGEAVYLWGAMIEAGSYATSYIPTSGSTVTRAAETCNGAGTSADFNDSEGVLFAEISALADSSDNRVITISDGTTNNRVQVYLNGSNGISGGIISGGSGQATLNYSGDTKINTKAAVKYKVNDFALWVNGFEIATDVIGSAPLALSEIDFDNGAGSANFYGNTKQLITFKQALTDAELEDLTSWDSFSEMATQQLYTIE